MGRSLRTLSLLKGLPVFVTSTGEKLGTVFDLCLAEHGRVEGLILRKGALIKKSYLIPFEEVSSFGADGVMIEETTILQPLKETYQLFEGKERLVGKPLVSSTGESLGILADVYFQEELGTIVGYECSDGFFADITEGKRVVKTDEPPMFGKDAIIVNIQP